MRSRPGSVEVWRVAVRWIGIVTSPFSLGITIFLLVREALGHPVSPNQALAIIGYGVVVACIIALGASWWLTVGERRQLEQQVEALEDARPAATVQIDADRNDRFLLVRNVGALGRFRAEIKILARQDWLMGAHTGKVYTGHWERSPRPDPEILPLLHDRLYVAGISHLGGGAQSLALYYHADDNSLGKFTQDWFSASDPPIPKPVLRLGVTISSDPPMRGGPFVGEFMLSPEGLVRADPGQRE
jgi:hypothetical protein